MRWLRILFVLALAPGIARAETAPRFMLNVKLGPSFALQASYYTVVAEVDFGVAVTPDRRGYVVFAPQVEAGSAVAILILPVGFQYEFALPVRGLYVYPRLLVGYGVILFGTPIEDIHLGVVAAEAGIKYVVHDRWTVGLEPLSLPILFTRTVENVEYRFFAYGGVRF